MIKSLKLLMSLEINFGLRGFSSMSVADVCAATNLQKEEAILAKKECLRNQYSGKIQRRI